MRRLVGDLLLLARADARRTQPRRSIDLGEVLTEAAAELGPIAYDHDLSIDAGHVTLAGVRDDLHRMALNLMENAIRHTPPGTQVTASTGREGDSAVLVVEDIGPGIPADIRRRVFERFVRAGGDGARGSGLGLAIVRAVAESHGGSVSLEEPSGGHGSRFVVQMPVEPTDQHPPAPESVPVPVNGAGATAAGGAATGGPDQTSTTTGSTIGRRRSRS
jgi:signal transduction histidine kinase